MDGKLPHDCLKFERVVEQLHEVARHVREMPVSQIISGPKNNSSPQISAIQEEIRHLERSIQDLDAREQSLRKISPSETLKAMSNNLNRLEDTLMHNQQNIQGMLESMSPKASSMSPKASPSPSQDLSQIQSTMTQVGNSLDIQESFAKEQIGVMDQLDAVCTSVHQSVTQSAATLHQHRIYLQSEQLRQFNERQRLHDWETQLRSREEKMLQCIDHIENTQSSDHVGKLRLFESFYHWAKHES